MIIGCSASCVICDGIILADSRFVSIAGFTAANRNIFCNVSENKKQRCEEFSEKLVKGRNGFILLFLPVYYSKGKSCSG